MGTAALAAAVWSTSCPAATRCCDGVTNFIFQLAEVDCRALFARTVKDAAEANFAACICSEPVGKDKVERNPPLIMASEDFSFMLEQVPGCCLNIGNGGAAGSCEAQNPAYDFNNQALPLGAAFFARAAETRLAAA